MINNEILWGQILYYSFILIGLASLMFGVFFLVSKNYKEFEDKTMDGISDYAGELYRLFDLMFMRKSLNFCYALIVSCSLFFGFIGFVAGLQLSLFWSVVAAAGLGFMGFRMPGAVVRSLFNRRVAKFDTQLVDALNMMANAIKSGLSFMQVVQLLEAELDNPASEEFATALKENRIGVNLNDALMNMTKRVPSEDLFMIINSVVTLSQQGGDLSEAFETIAYTIRERQRVHEKIKTLAQAGLTQATILSALPLAIMGMMYAMQPEQVIPMFTTKLGLTMLGIMVTMIAMGAFWMKKILTIEI